ncbi:hypothetical protein [Streptomyces showdoensis]|nr:hypothetical protein [Streptomyces showdoensis]
MTNDARIGGMRTGSRGGPAPTTPSAPLTDDARIPPAAPAEAVEAAGTG